jgi:hypothetical protein
MRQVSSRCSVPVDLLELRAAMGPRTLDLAFRVLLAASALSPAGAQSGSPDPTFGTNGCQ